MFDLYFQKHYPDCRVEGRHYGERVVGTGRLRRLLQWSNNNNKIVPLCSTEVAMEALFKLRVYFEHNQDTELEKHDSYEVKKTTTTSFYLSLFFRMDENLDIAMIFMQSTSQFILVISFTLRP